MNRSGAVKMRFNCPICLERTIMTTWDMWCANIKCGMYYIPCVYNPYETNNYSIDLVPNGFYSTSLLRLMDTVNNKSR